MSGTRHISPLAAFGRIGLIALGAVAIAVLLATTIGAQSLDDYPDLVSDPPENVQPPAEITWQGDDMLVVTFDGFVTNVGGGPLHIEGDPQPAASGTAGAVAQHILNGSGSSIASFPLSTTGPEPDIQFENTDDHNHWHLMRIMEYSLWDESQSVQVTGGEKIGFCLWDIERVGLGPTDAVYDGGGNWCAGVGYPGGGPGATDLAMGVSAGWRDTYNRFINLQWVDVSDVAPGTYYLAALADPNDIVEESDETNNSYVWVDTPTVVPGYLATDVSASVSEGANSLELGSQTFGTPGLRRYEIASEPANGSLSREVAVPFASSTVDYSPNAGFEGCDSFEYLAYDSLSDYPRSPNPGEVNAVVVVKAGSTNCSPYVKQVADVTARRGSAVSRRISAFDAEGDPLTYAAEGLPDGLTVDSTSGIVDGSSLAAPGTYLVTVSVSDASGSADQSFRVTLENVPPHIVELPDRSDEEGDAVSLRMTAVDSEGDALSYSAIGLPTGLAIDESSGEISGSLTQPGAYETTVTVSDGFATDSVIFDWTVNPAEPDPSEDPEPDPSPDPSSPPPAPPSFTDVPDGHLFADAIGWMAAERITTGCTTTQFCPDDPVTRGQIASFLARALELSNGAGADLFMDDDGSVHEDNIDRLATAGITNGCTATEFCPEAQVTRAQFASLLVRAMGYTDGAGADLFVDDDGSVHEDNIDRLATAGITNGCTATEFCPEASLTRGQLAALLFRAMG